MLEDNKDWIAGAVEALADGADFHADTRSRTPRQKLGKARAASKPKMLEPSRPDSAAPDKQRNPRANRAAETEQGEANARSKTSIPTPPPPELPGRISPETQSSRAGQTLSNVGGQAPDESQCDLAADIGIQTIVEKWRYRMDMLRARQRLELQAQSNCRRFVDGDKTKAAKLWAEVRKDEAHELRIWLQAYIDSMAPLDAQKARLEKDLAKQVKSLPIYPWAKSVAGLGEVSLAGIIGECGTGPGEYRSVSALWKRMGLAVIGGQRQRRIAGAEAIEHGYNAERRSHIWNIGGCLMKAQLRSEKDDKGKKIEGSEYAIGELGRVYLERKAYLRERDPERSAGHIHNDAKRYMEKRLLRQLWQEWRRAQRSAETSIPPLAADKSTAGGQA